MHPGSRNVELKSCSKVVLFVFVNRCFCTCVLTPVFSSLRQYHYLPCFTVSSFRVINSAEFTFIARPFMQARFCPQGAKETFGPDEAQAGESDDEGDALNSLPCSQFTGLLSVSVFYPSWGSQNARLPLGWGRCRARHTPRSTAPKGVHVCLYPYVEY